MAKPTASGETGTVEKRDNNVNATNSQQAAWLLKGTGQSIKVLLPDQFEAGETSVTSKTGFELLCTYNWALTKVPSIYVPGAPAQWTEQNLPITLPRDTGSHFIDQNAYRVPQFPFEPLFRALQVMKPEFSLNDIDLVTNRNSLRKLFDFVKGRARDSFRIDLHMVQKTLFLTRRERNTREIIYGSRDSGYGHNFEHTFSTPEPGIEDSASHHRVIRYALGDLNCVVRFEVDACCPKVEGQGSECEILLPPPASSDDMPRSLEHMSLQENKNTSAAGKSKSDPTHVVHRGRLVPSSTVAEIKARSKGSQVQKALPQLWFGRTPHLICGFHKNGTFDKIETIDVSKQYQDWETQHQDSLRRMVQLISCLRRITMEEKASRCVVVYKHKVKPPSLEVFASSVNNQVLPKGIISQYWTKS
ncbi:hypothetical protein EPUS_01525 [Endocarpon pusillum Z07020]|uniref:Geranylgeranyl pyrophosphate synthetase n=1 Tax=Endocarpon pusillum (strain Z07020 / HMAS-L-300199) TaxID=1263415 RepID=U1HXZ2_ENDPU|nr:uncharacterized protein EPUS_01525 [Endocarpon pusillum Z07020]ERF75695.1 hypothetical protein EPUS_01525 [Endocarpon pusillum Z07020]